MTGGRGQLAGVKRSRRAAARHQSSAAQPCWAGQDSDQAVSLACLLARLPACLPARNPSPAPATPLPLYLEAERCWTGRHGRPQARAGGRAAGARPGRAYRCKLSRPPPPAHRRHWACQMASVLAAVWLCGHLQSTEPHAWPRGSSPGGTLAQVCSQCNNQHICFWYRNDGGPPGWLGRGR